MSTFWALFRGRKISLYWTSPFCFTLAVTAANHILNTTSASARSFLL